MKRSYNLFYYILLVTLFISCKSEKKNNFIDVETVKIGWTAYKTTDKVAVKGEFTKVDIEENVDATNLKEALNGLKFSIPVSSLFSNNEERDTKLKDLFFGVMDQTELISGVITIISDTQGNATVKMNGVSVTFPITFETDNNSLSLTGILNLNDFNTQSAMTSLNKACLDLHKGADGISKTWSDVKIDVSFSKAK